MEFDWNDPEQRKKLIIAAAIGLVVGLIILLTRRREPALVAVDQPQTGSEPTTDSGGTLSEEDISGALEGITQSLYDMLAQQSQDTAAALDALSQQFADALGGVWEYLSTTSYPVDSYGVGALDASWGWGESYDQGDIARRLERPARKTPPLTTQAEVRRFRSLAQHQREGLAGAERRVMSPLQRTFGIPFARAAQTTATALRQTFRLAPRVQQSEIRRFQSLQAHMTESRPAPAPAPATGRLPRDDSRLRAKIQPAAPRPTPVPATGRLPRDDSRLRRKLEW